MIDPTSSPSPLPSPKVRSIGRKFQPSNYLLTFFSAQLPSLGPFPKVTLLTVKTPYCSYHLGNSKHSRSSVPEMGMKTKYIFIKITLIYLLNKLNLLLKPSNNKNSRSRELCYQTFGGEIIPVLHKIFWEPQERRLPSSFDEASLTESLKPGKVLNQVRLSDVQPAKHQDVEVCGRDRIYSQSNQMKRTNLISTSLNMRGLGYL